METESISSFLFTLARSSAEAGVLVVLVLITQWVFQKQLAPRWRCALWLIVVLRLLLPFSFSSVASVFNLFPHWTPPASPIPAVMPLPVAAPQSSAILTSVPASAEPMEPLLSFSAVSGHHWSWPVAIFVVWLVGVFLLAGYVLVSFLKLWRRFGRLRPVTEPAALNVFSECCDRLRIRTRPSLLESSEVSSPALYGMVHPRLLLPKGFTSKFSGQELRFVFLHELAHLKRRDLLVNWAMTAVQVFHWFNPLVWFAFGRWRADREFACDAMAMEAAGEAQNKDYGRTILRLLESFANPMNTPGLVGVLEDKRQLRRRIGMIASYAPTRGWPRLAFLLIVVLAVTGLTDAQRTSRSATVSPTGQNQSLNKKLAEQEVLCIKLKKELIEFQTIQATNPIELAYVLQTINLDTSLSGLLDKLHRNQQKFATETNYLTLAIPDVASTFRLIVTNKLEITDRVTAIMHGLEAQLVAAGTQVAGLTNRFNEFEDKPTRQKGDSMNKSTIAAPAAAALLALATPATTVNLHGEDAPPPAAGQTQLANELIGAWIWVDAPGYQTPPPGANYKFFTRSHWCTTHADPKSGVVISHHGGTYDVKGNEYDESVEYANPSTMDRIGHRGKFTIQIKGDMLTNIGIDNGWRQVWKRVKPEAAANSPLAGELTGAWKLVSAPNEIGSDPLPGEDLKLYADGHWCDSYAEPKYGVVVEHHGGTYAVKGDTYSETVDYANPDRMNLIGQTFNFDMKISGDTLTITGVNNPWNEIWKRAD